MQQAALDPEDAGLEHTLAVVREQKAVTLAHDGQRMDALSLARVPGSAGLMRDLASNLLLGGEVAQIIDAMPQACSCYREGKALFRRVGSTNGLSDYASDQAMGDVEQSIAATC